jgi:lipoprotein-anchoring transpeptidase ErfK/SrfK
MYTYRNENVMSPRPVAHLGKRHTVIAICFVALLANLAGTIPRAVAEEVPTSVDVAIAKDRYVAIYDDATGTKPRIRLDAYRNFSHRLVFRIRETQGNRYLVDLPIRPNGSTGFIDKQNINVVKTEFFIRVSLSAHTVTVYQRGAILLTDKVGVGKKGTPTPLGTFYVSELARVTNKGSEYGPWAFGISAFSPKITRFKGGSGQIGFHGTNRPQDIGKDVSHGCIRVSNATITKLAKVLPQGTPFEVVA